MTQALDPLSPEMLMRRYELAAGKAAVVELKLRILAETVEELQQYAHEFKFPESRVFEWFATHGDPIDESDQKSIEASRTLRNKLLHGDLYRARNKMHELGAEKRRSGGKSISLESGARTTLEQVVEAVQSMGTLTDVADTKTENTGIGVWLLEFAITGDFEQAVALLTQTSDLLERMIQRASVIEIRKSRATPT